MDSVVAWIIGIVVVGSILMLYWRRERKRYDAIISKPFPEEWKRILRDNVALYGRLPDELRERLHKEMKLFLAEVKMTACCGMELTDEVRVTVGGLACIPLIGEKQAGINRSYILLKNILICPEQPATGDYHAEEIGRMFQKMVNDGDDFGPIVLAWKDVLNEARGGVNRCNVTLHECAGWLDIMWFEVMDHSEAVDEQLKRLWVERRRPDWKEESLGPSEKEDTRKAFATATEMYFEDASEMMRQYPDLYGDMKEYYGLDPAVWK